MYKLSYFQAVNVIGFVSGLGKRNFVLDLEGDKGGKLLEKDILVILGDNATGKSTLLSLIHPTHTPSDDRQKFIVPGKEGMLLRKYTGEDGTEITTKCVYRPKDGKEGHSPKCFFRMKRPDQTNGVELNESGNVTSYNSLLFTYFGVNKDYVNFASYSDAVNNIVEMTSTERKNSISSLIPNTGRFELAFNTVNEKYKELRNMIRNVSQKILAIRDEETLIHEFERVNKDLHQAEEDRDELMIKLAKAEGRIKELSHGQNVDEMLKKQNELIAELTQMDYTCQRYQEQIIECCEKLDLNYDPEDPMHVLENQMTAMGIQKYERKVATSEALINTADAQAAKVKKELDQCYKEQEEAEAALVGIQTQDINDLRRMKLEYERELSKSRYGHHKELYENMSYDEVITFSNTVSTIDQMIQALYEEYGNIVTRYFQHLDTFLYRNDYNKEDQRLQASILTSTKKRDEIYRQLVEKEQYRKLQTILDQRPSACKIDTCPFIVNALKWEKIADEIKGLKAEYETINVSIKNHEDQLHANAKELQAQQLILSLVNQIKSQATLFAKYLDLTPDELFHAIGNGTWTTKLDMSILKSIAAILSEKDRYMEITTRLLPEVDRSIEIARVYGTNREMLENQIKRINSSIKRLKKELNRIYDQRYISSKMIEHYQEFLTLWKTLENALRGLQDMARSRVAKYDTAYKLSEEIDSITELHEKMVRNRAKLNDALDRIRELTPIRQQLIIDQKNLIALKKEKLDIEHDFVIVEIMKQIIQPGKGIRKELINLYMYDIYQTANQLLLNTFNGKLYLKEFIITDKDFIIPYVYNGTEGTDIAYASSSQQSTISMSLSLAIISKMIDKYGVLAIDEADRTLSSENKAIFADILNQQMKMIGVTQAFIITHTPEYYEGTECGIIGFPGAKFHKKGTDYIMVSD